MAHQDFQKVVDAFKEFSPQDRQQFGAVLPSAIGENEASKFMTEGLGSALQNIPTNQKTAAVQSVVAAQPSADQKEIAKGVNNSVGMGAPTSRVRDSLWLFVISTLCLVLLSATVALVVGMFRPPATNGVKPELILSIFTSVIGFVVGIFVPSPTQKS